MALLPCLSSCAGALALFGQSALIGAVGGTASAGHDVAVRRVRPRASAGRGARAARRFPAGVVAGFTLGVPDAMLRRRRRERSLARRQLGGVAPLARLREPLRLALERAR